LYSYCVKRDKARIEESSSTPLSLLGGGREREGTREGEKERRRDGRKERVG
jgi:hypothetical protein